MRILRLFHTAASRCMLAPGVHVEKSALAKLRKATGYSFSKCKEALQKYENDLPQAEQWLRSQAQAHGWEKATKLQGRTTLQGLVTILSSPSSAVMMEINCETDFVARNKKFQGLCQKLTQGCHQFSNNLHPAAAPVSKIPLMGEKLTNLPIEESRTIMDEIALSIGEIGENIQTRRAVCLKSTEPVMLEGYTHPAPPEPSGNTKVVMQGRYGAIVAFRPVGADGTGHLKNKKSVHLIGRQLCQHIIGMNPKEIGSMEPPVVPEVTEFSEKVESKESQPPVEEKGDSKEGEKNLDDGEATYIPEVVETSLMNQEFLLDPDITVREFLVQNSVEVLDFVRFECGETIEPTYCE